MDFDTYRIHMTAKPKIQEDAEPEPKLTGEQVANFYKVTGASVRRWRRDGMPCIWYNSKMVRYELSKVEAWLRERGAKPRPAIIPPHERKKMEEEAKAAETAGSSRFEKSSPAKAELTTK
jgi:hypothetical protein